MLTCTERVGTLDDLTGEVLRFSPSPKPRGRKKKDRPTYAREMLAFDIETTSIPSIRQAIIYHWQLQVGDKITITGRYPEEITTAFQRISDALKVQELVAVCWVHNLAFEFQHLRSLVPLTKVFAADIRSPIKAYVGNVELRCSYLQSGVSLEKLTRDYKVAHPKAAGDLDYRVLRYPWTPLTDEEVTYCLNDVRGLVEAMDARMEERGDNIYTVPLTKTGYIRKQVKQVLQPLTQWAYQAQKNFTVYQALRRAFRGGNTHASRFYAGQIVGPAYEWDRSSSYPDVMVNCKFPRGKFSPLDPDLYWDFFDAGEQALLADVRIMDLHLKDELWPVPYLSRDKCRYVHDAVFDNGRILSAGYLETTLTDIDMQILTSEYDCTIIVDRCWKSPYTRLPSQFVSVINRLYHNKTALKGVEGRESDYALSKEDINSAYGMCVQDPGKPDICFRYRLVIFGRRPGRAIPGAYQRNSACIRLGGVDHRLGPLPT